MRLLATAAVAVALLAGCGSGESDFDDSKCVPLSQDKLASIAEGFKSEGGKILQGQAVELPDDEKAFNIAYAAAIELEQAGNTDTVILGLSSPDDGAGTIIAADNLSRVYFTWGEAATDGSPIGNYRDGLFVSDTAKTAKKCLS